MVSACESVVFAVVSARWVRNPKGALGSVQSRMFFAVPDHHDSEEEFFDECARVIGVRVDRFEQFLFGFDLHNVRTMYYLDHMQSR